MSMQKGVRSIVKETAVQPNARSVTAYSNRSLVKQARIYFEKTVPQSITLHTFFSDLCYNSLRQSILGLVYTERYNPTQHKYGFSELGASRAVFEYTDVLSALVEISGLKNIKCVGAFAFGSGSYTILADSSSRSLSNGFARDSHKESKALAFFDFSSSWDPTWGGRDVFVDGTGNFVYVPVLGNTVTIVSLSGMQHFVEYVNHYAEDRRRFVVVYEMW